MSHISPKARRIILTGGVTVITITGTLWGAGLKMRQESKQEEKKQLAATPEERIRSLESVKEGLLVRRRKLEDQIKGIEAKQERKAAADSSRKEG